MLSPLEDSSDSSSDASDDLPEPDRRETYRSIRLCPLNVDSAVPSTLQITNTNSYSVLNDQINEQLGRTNLSVLQSFFGPWPWWKFPDDDATIPLSINTLYLVDRNKPFVLALLRTEIEDRPLLIDNPESITNRTLNVLHEAMEYKSLKLERVEMHGSFNQIEEGQIFDYTDLQCHLTFPTTFYILSEHSKDSFKFKTKPTSQEPIPVALETTISDCEKLIDRVASRQWISMQGIHISRALLHLIVSLADADRRDYEIPCKNLDIRRLGQNFEDILIKLDASVTDQTPLTGIMADLESLFQQCCDDYPGSVAVRYSYDSFKKLGQYDLHEMRNLGTETVQARNNQISTQSTKSTLVSRTSRIPKYGSDRDPESKDDAQWLPSQGNPAPSRSSLASSTATTVIGTLSTMSITSTAVDSILGSVPKLGRQRMFFPSRVPAETTKISKTQHSNNTTWKMLNQYRVIRLLGRGTHGAVKYGEDMSKADPLDPDYAVAIKIIKRIPGRGNTIITSARIRYEIAVMKRCIHDNIVRLIEVIDDPRSYAVFLVMEYLEGGEIKWRGYDGPLLSLHQIRRITRDVLLGLEYLHYMGIIHRDIKPSNMLWTRGRAKVKLSDFGVSRFSKPLKPHISEGDSAYEDNDSHLNKAEGTPAFYAPEQAYKQIGLPSPTFPSGKRPPGANVDQIYPMTRALDVWAFGASIYCFLFGKPPYWGLNVHAVCNDIIESDYIIPPHATVDQLSVNSDDPNMQQVLELMKGMMTKPVYLRMTLSQAKVLPWLTGDLEHPETWLRETDLEADLEAGGSVMRSEIDPVNALVPKDHSLHVSSIMKALFIRKENDQSQQQGRVDTRFIGGEYPLSLEQSTHPTLPSPRSTYRPSADLPAPPIGSYASTLTASSPAHFGDSYLGRSANVMPKPKADELKQVINSFLRKNKVLSSAEAIVTPVLISPMHHADHDMSAFSSPSSATGFLQGTPPISVVDYQDLDPVLITYSSEELDDDEEGDVQLLGFGGYEAYNLVSRNAPSPSETLVGGISDVTKKQLSTISDTSKLLTGDDFPRPTTPPLPGSSFAVDSQSTIPPTPSPNTSAVVYPQSHTMVSPTSNHRQLFNERLQRYQLSARFDFKSEGPQHAQKWRCFCYILNTFVGCSHWYTNKAAAKEEAAGHALEWLDKFGYH